MNGSSSSRSDDSASQESRQLPLACLSCSADPAGIPGLLGRLEVVPLSDVLQLLAMQRQSGVLDVVAEGTSTSISMRRGLVEMAMSDGSRPEFLLGRYLIEDDLVAAQDLDIVVRNNRGGRPLGELLERLGYISRADLQRALRRQTCEIIYEALRWPRGVFAFRAETSLRQASSSDLRLDVPSLIMEGLRQFDEWRVIERTIPSFETVLEPLQSDGALFPQANLSDEEAFILELVDGQSTVAQIIELSCMNSYTVCRILYRLLAMKRVATREA